MGEYRLNKDNIVLIGFAGTGKTTVSKLLAARLSGWHVVDTDALIEAREGKTIPELFSGQGEAYFRSVEQQVIADVMQRSQQIISTGGGAVLHEENRQWMTQHGWVIALTASVETIVARVREDTNRPLFHGGVEERVRKLLQDREHAYDFAHHKIDTTLMTAEEVVEHILQLRQ